MTLYEFNALNESEQNVAITMHGIIVGQRIKGKHQITLRRLFSFYLELTYDTEVNMIDDLRRFSNPDPLDALNKFELESSTK